MAKRISDRNLFGHRSYAYNLVDGSCRRAASRIARQSRTSLILHIGEINTWWLAMQLWLSWWEVISLLQPVFFRWRTFVWFSVCVAGLSVRADRLGVTSIVRALGLDGKYYDNLLDSLHSTGVKLDALSATWTKVVLRVFPAWFGSTAGLCWWVTASR